MGIATTEAQGRHDEDVAHIVEEATAAALLAERARVAKQERVVELERGA